MKTKVKVSIEQQMKEATKKSNHIKNSKEMVDFLISRIIDVHNHKITTAEARVISSLAHKVVRIWALQLEQNKQLGITKPILFLLPSR
jgi:hypothetical protein